MIFKLLQPDWQYNYYVSSLCKTISFTHIFDEGCQSGVHVYEDLQQPLCGRPYRQGGLDQLMQRVHQHPQPRAHRLLVALTLGQLGGLSTWG